MKFRKRIGIIATVLTLTVLFLQLSHAQVTKEQTLIFPGVIEQVTADSKSVIVNEARISLSSNTQIVDENGNPLTLYDLKRGSPVTLEVVRHASGFLARKIVLKTPGR